MNTTLITIYRAFMLHEWSINDFNCSLIGPRIVRVHFCHNFGFPTLAFTVFYYCQKDPKPDFSRFPNKGLVNERCEHVRVSQRRVDRYGGSHFPDTLMCTGTQAHNATVEWRWQKTIKTNKCRFPTENPGKSGNIPDLGSGGSGVHLYCKI